ncbi:aldo/keto reductase [Herbiconiux sp. L3-i23]|uniref:aldo/keto reductase n=1 Tax=Herbiconiux sp. L3-i23 TaxID=2905871 RepID=UPI00205DFA6E|nr:NADP-dependent aryl-alcohol dehydrogenase [Herbiconiux sp. L3-i23]
MTISTDALVPVGGSDLRVFPLSLGGNVFGWTTDRDTAFDVLDAFRAGGGNLVDTADSYSAWVPGNSGGESERIIGEWIASRGVRDDTVIATKVSQHPEFRGLAATNVRSAAEASLSRLGTSYIDVYYAHYDDEATPLAETVEAFSRLVDDGLVRTIGLSNYTAERIDEWVEIADRGGFHRPTALQPQYNLVERGFETALQSRAATHDLGVFPYYALAAGFLTGKYRPGADRGDSPRAGQAAGYLDARGIRILGALDQIAAAHGVSVTSVALAWLRARPTVVAPIASARTIDQLPDLLVSASLELADDEMRALDAASESTPEQAQAAARRRCRRPGRFSMRCSAFTRLADIRLGENSETTAKRASEQGSGLGRQCHH